VLIPGLSNKDAEAVFVGTTAAAAVYLGTTMVWPNVTGTPGVMGENLITNPTNNRYGELWQLAVPAAAVTVDVVMIGGGGGAQDGGPLGSGKGGGVGNWVTATYTIATDYPGRVMSGKVGYGGPGAQALPNFGSSDGFPATLLKADNTIAIQSGGGKREGASGRTGATPPDCVYNGRTYVGGAGGSSSNMNGVNGQAPGGGGQGGAAEITGTYGGQGGAAGIYLFFA
jgi:hypothetical protein